MNEVVLEDFISEMYFLVREEGFLFEAPLGATDRLPSGDVVHGPWDPADCATILGRWHAEGLIGLWVRKPAQTDYELSADDAARLLDAPARWQPESDDGLVSVVLTDLAADAPYERWRELALEGLVEA